jgi:hypothetical protein
MHQEEFGQDLKRMFEKPEKFPKCKGYSTRVSGAETVVICLIVVVVIVILWFVLF